MFLDKMQFFFAFIIHNKEKENRGKFMFDSTESMYYFETRIKSF